MLGIIYILSGPDGKREDPFEAVKSLCEKILVFISRKIWPFIRDYRFIVFGVLLLLFIGLIIIWARKHVPSRGRIIDMYDATGKRREKKNKKIIDNELHDLPKEFYKRK